MTKQKDESTGLDVSSAITDGMVVHRNLKQEIVFTTVDKLRICLMEGKTNLESGTEWVGAAGLAVSLITTLIAADFKDVGVKAPTWQAIYILGAIASLIWTLMMLIKAVRIARSGGLEALITRISNRTTLAPGSVTYEQAWKALGGVFVDTTWPVSEEKDKGGA